MSVQAYQRDLNRFFAGREPDRKAHYEELSRNEGDAEQIKNLLETFNRVFEEEPNIIHFGVRYSLALWRSGRRLQQLHPLVFFDSILKNDELMNLAKKVYSYRNDAFKWLKNFFMSGLERSFQIEFENENLMQHISGFSKNFPEKEQYLAELALENQWRDFIAEVFEASVS